MKLTLLSLLCGFVALASAAEEPRLAILADPAAATEADLLTAGLSQQPVRLLERVEIERVLAEQKLALSGLASTELPRVGQLLKADGVIFLSKEGKEKQKTLALRCVAVHPGVVIESSREDAPADLAKWSSETAARLAALLPKLAVSKEAAVPVSVLNLRVTRSRPEAAEIERELTVLLTHRLAHEPALFVLEREKMAALAEEKAEAAAPFWTGRWLIDGAIEQAPSDPDQLTITARLQPPGKGEMATVQHICRRGQLPAAAEALTQQIAVALQQKPSGKTWDAAREAEQFGREAQWALRTGLYSAAARAAEASWALGLRTAEVLATRARGELLEAHPKMASTSSGDYLWRQAQFWRFDLQKMGGAPWTQQLRKTYREMPAAEREQRLQTTIHGVSLVRDHIDLVQGDRELIDQTLAMGGGMLDWLGTNRDGAFDEGMRTLRTAVRELVEAGSTRMTDFKIPRDNTVPEFWQLKVAFAPLLARSPAETVALWRHALAQPIIGGSGARLRVTFAHARDLCPELVVERAAQAPQAAVLWNELLVDLAVSEFAGDRLISAHCRAMLKGQTWGERDPLPPQVEEAYWAERASFADEQLGFEYMQLLGLPRGSVVRDPAAIPPPRGDTTKLDFSRKMLLYLLNDCVFVPRVAFSELYHPDLYTEGEAREIYQAIIAYDERVAAKFGSRITLKMFRERSRELLMRFPKLVPPSLTPGISVTRYWSPYKVPGVIDALRRPQPLYSNGVYADGRFWLITNYEQAGANLPYPERPYSIFGVDLKTLEAEHLACPAPPPPRERAKNSSEGNHLAVTPKYIFVVHAAQLARYDRESKKWTYYPELANVFAEPWLVANRLYVRTDNSRRPDYSRRIGELTELNLDTGEQRLLVNDRRNPPESLLDALPSVNLIALAAPKGGSAVWFRGKLPSRPYTSWYAAYEPGTRKWSEVDGNAAYRAFQPIEEPPGWRAKTRGLGADPLYLELRDVKIPYHCTLSALDRQLLHGKVDAQQLTQIEQNFIPGFSIGPSSHATPDGVIVYGNATAPGFWFVPQAEIDDVVKKTATAQVPVPADVPLPAREPARASPGGSE